MDEASGELCRVLVGCVSGGTGSKTLSDLHDAGKLTDEEFAKGKAKLIVGG